MSGAARVESVRGELTSYMPSSDCGEHNVHVLIDLFHLYRVVFLHLLTAGEWVFVLEYNDTSIPSFSQTVDMPDNVLFIDVR